MTESATIDPVEEVEGGRSRSSRILFWVTLSIWVVGDWALHSGERYDSWLAWGPLCAVVGLLGLGAWRLSQARDEVRCLRTIFTVVVFGLPASGLWVAWELFGRADGTESSQVLWMRATLNVVFLLNIIVNTSLQSQVQSHRE